MKESVLCVDSNNVDLKFPHEPFIVSSNLWRTLANLHIKYIPRDEAETDESWRQLIPYVIVKTPSGVFAYRRQGDEKRLHDLWSIGVGGHVNRNDASVQRALNRELEEELGLATTLREEDVKGLIKSNRTPVDRVHLGLVYVLCVENSAWTPSKETEMWTITRVAVLKKVDKRFESWSVLCLENSYLLGL